MHGAERKHAHVKRLAPLRLLPHVLREVGVADERGIQHVDERCKEADASPDLAEHFAREVAKVGEDGEKPKEQC